MINNLVSSNPVGAEMCVLHMGGADAFSDWSLLGALTSSGSRPNMLVVCDGVPARTVVEHVAGAATSPLLRCALPGPLTLPELRAGTLVLDRVEALTTAQQIELFDWLSAGRGSLQIVSIAHEPLEDVVADGRFLEGLYYRLNVVRVETGDELPHAAYSQAALRH